MSRRSSPLSSVSAGYIESLYGLFRSHPERLDESWRCVFGVLDLVGEANGSDILAGLVDPAPEIASHAALADLIRARGHLLARLDPLAASAEQADAASLLAHSPPPPLAADEMAARYVGSLAVETAHIDDPGLRNWLIAARETESAPPSRDERWTALLELIRADEFERFLGRKFPTKKRFGAEGAEAMIPLLRGVLRRAAAAGVTHAVIGTMHRGRLNIGANVLGRSLAQMLAEIQGAHPFPVDPPRPGDVPYHLGHAGTLDTGAGSIAVTLLANPSHLEAVDPVVLGHARAIQDAMGPDGAARVMPIIVHTDAAVIGQGVVAETLQLAGVPGFAVGGTLHLVVNNQIGFTTERDEARTSTHCTGAWKAVDSCIVHVNGDDPSAVMRAGDLAVDWRQAHARDAVIDLVCYRRNGHNEIDEPTFTQPVTYERISRHVPVAEATTRRLIAEGVVTEHVVREATEAYRAELDAAYEASRSHRSNVGGYRVQPSRSSTPTGVETDRLQAIADVLATPPEDVALHPKMARLLRQRSLSQGGIAWPVAESLAFGTLLQDGVAIRLTGQDVVRGAFSHRHYSLVDGATGGRHTALARLPGARAPFAIHNSPLSEYAVLGFEYGYSLEAANGLTLWEAQFGDFANGAQIILDQFIAGGEEKWCAASGLVLLLPHGLEGQGPEHSSARLERFLQMAAGGNMRIANPSTPANYFHLLRRQALEPERKPLIVMGAKRLLRLPAATSPLSAFGPDGAFVPLLADIPEGGLDRILLCSGKIAYDLLAERIRRHDRTTAIVRIEQLYPLPSDALLALFRSHPDAACRWVQEEPRNMGAWSWLDRRIEAVRREAATSVAALSYVGRPEAGSPAGSFHGDHEDEQARIVAQAFDMAV